MTGLAESAGKAGKPPFWVLSMPRTSMDMYTEGAQTTGHHHLLLQHSSTVAPCPCQRCVHREPQCGFRRWPGYPPPPGGRHPDHQREAPRVKDVGGRALVSDGVERSGHRSPQRRPVFAGPGPYSHTDDSSQVCPWELNPAQWNYPPEPGLRHYPSVREQCGCVVRADARAHPFIPHPLPHLQVRGRGHRRTAPHGSREEEGDKHRREPQADRLSLPNGHCGPRAVYFEGGEERDCHRERGRPKGGSEEDCNGRFHRGFFTTEVPQKHLQPSRAKGPPCVPRGGGGGGGGGGVGGGVGGGGSESPKPQRPANGEQQITEVVKQKRRQDLVRDQIRQVVTDLEDVLGGLKQVHVEMKEVVEQIDRLTANIDLSEEPLSITQGPYTNCHGSTHSGNPKVAPTPNHKPAAVPGSQHFDEDRIILRTNSPSPVHMASVVKTSCFTPPGHGKDANHDKPGVNGHPPHLHHHRDSNSVGLPDPRPQTLDPNVIIGNTTSSSRTQKPPPYPQNGRCGKGSYPPPKPVRTPAYPGRGRQSTSMV